MLAILTTHPIQYQVPLWKALAEDGRLPFEVWYLSNHGTKPSYDIQFGQTFAWDIDTLSGYPHRFLKVNRNPNLGRFSGLRIEESLSTLLQEKNVQALWIQGWQVVAYWQAVWVAHRQGIPVWLRAETNDLHRSHWLKRLPRNFALSQLFNRISRFFYIGSANRRFYQQFRVPDSKLVAAPYFVDNECFARAARELLPNRKQLRQQWNIPEEARCFLFCGKFITKKHPLDLLAAVKILLGEGSISRDHPQFHLLMVGDGELRSMLEEKVRELESIAGHALVTFTGFLNQTNMPKAYIAADCLVLPSDTGETWGLVVNEAMACGRLAIVSNLCGCAEDLVRPLDESYVYPCGDIAELAQRLRIVLLEKMKSSSFDKMNSLLEKHSIQTVVASTLTTYKELLNRAID